MSYSDFPMMRITALSLSKRTLAYGVGINDADYIVSPVVDGKQITCPIYKTWMSMLKRCYCKHYLIQQPTYAGCYVYEEWKIFSNFRNWVLTQDWEDKQLDKDILFAGNKVYSPETCLFVRHRLNVFIVAKDSVHLNLPLGVMKLRGNYKAQASFDGVKWRSETYSNPEDAHRAYLKKKIEYLYEVIEPSDDPRILPALLLRYKEK